MGKIKVTPCPIKGLFVIEPTVFKDERGYFVETYNQNDFREAGLDMVFRAGQPVHVRERACFGGFIFPEAVSPGQAGARHPHCVRCGGGPAVRLWNLRQVVRRGALRGEQEAVLHSGRLPTAFWCSPTRRRFAYKCTDFYHPGDEGGLLWSDPEIGVEWPIEEEMELIISRRIRSGAAKGDVQVLRRRGRSLIRKERTLMDYVISLAKRL